MSEFLMEMIGYQVQGTAEWRREKAEQFPHDAARNLLAAEELDQLAAQIEQVKGDEPIHRRFCDLQERINGADDDGKIWMDTGEDVSTELREIGFHTSYTTAQEFLGWYCDLLEEKLHDLLDETVPVPDLDEAVANDPTVKAAKQAYDEAYAKAYAEACKKL